MKIHNLSKYYPMENKSQKNEISKNNEYKDEKEIQTYENNLMIG